MAGRAKLSAPKPVPFSALAEVHAAGEREAKLAEAKARRTRRPSIQHAYAPNEVLTLKEEEFAQHVANGTSYSDALRLAYGLPDTIKPERVWVRASTLGRKPNVHGRIQELLRSREAATMQNGEAIRSFVLTTLHEIASTGKQEASRVAAASWLGRAPHANLFATQTIDVVDNRALDQVKSELSQRLSSLLPKLIATTKAE